ncbi:MAG: hypothetical protein R3F56_15205 [Planctomycetota bacterium]
MRGTVELSSGEADLAADALVAERGRGLLSARGRAQLEDSCPTWLPEFCREQVLARWLRATDGAGVLRVVDRVQTEHDHGALGTSYRTELTVRPDAGRIERSLGSLRHQVTVGAKRFAVKCAGIVGFWVLLALVVGWLDRLSRGYMTWRLRLLGAIAGTALPAVVLLLV